MLLFHCDLKRLEPCQFHYYTHDTKLAYNNDKDFNHKNDKV